MKILHLQLLPILSGVQNFSLRLLEGLDPNQYEIHIAGAGEGFLGPATRDRGWQYHSLRFLTREIGITDLFGLIELILLLRREKFDLVHTNSSKPGMLGRLAARICKVPRIVHTCHGLPFRQDQPWYSRRAFSLMEKISQSLGDISVFVNNSDRIYSVKGGLIPERKATTVYNAIPDTLRADLEKLRKRRKYQQGKEIVVGSTMRFSDQKNAVELVSTICRVCRRTEQMKFIIVGDGEHFGLCRQMVKSLGLNERILLPGWDNDVIPWLEVFDAFILYSRWEAQPFSIIEAMYAGLPVIGSDISSIGELVDEETGYIVPLSEPKKLEELIVDLGSEFSEAFAKGMKGAERIASICDYRQMVDAYDSIYKGLG